MATLIPTPSVEEGPYYKSGSPERTNIVQPGTPGSPLLLTGRVLDTAGNPVAGAWLDFWHADGNGVYDNEGFNLRGHQYTDEEGRYRLKTVQPLEYLFRAPHIHAKVRPRGTGPILTTQLFFPDHPRNEMDSLFEPVTVIGLSGAGEASFDFIIETAVPEERRTGTA